MPISRDDPFVSTKSKILTVMYELNLQCINQVLRTHHNIVELLRSFGKAYWCKSELHILDYDTVDIQNVNFLPPKFHDTIIFELPPKSTIKQFVGQTLGGGQMHGMDKKDCGDTWIITKTTNIENDLDFIFKRSHCLGHLQCKHLDCHWLLHLGWKNKIEWYGLSISQFLLGAGPPLKSTLACNYCKRAHVCVNTCDAHIYYVLPIKKDTTQACIMYAPMPIPWEKGFTRKLKKLSSSW
jgi:hypothetical protein